LIDGASAVNVVPVFREVLMSVRLVAAIALGALALAGSAAAQSSSTTTTTTTVEREGNRTTTTTRSRSSSASFDANAAIGALAGAIAGANAPRRSPESIALENRANPVRETAEVFGAWKLDDGSEDASECVLTLRDRGGLLGLRGVERTNCPRRFDTIRYYGNDQGDIVLYDVGSRPLARMLYIEGRLLGGGLTLYRPDDDRNGPWVEELEDRYRPGLYD
jgi:hypothetical protein